MEIACAWGQHPRSKASGVEVNKTFESRSLKGLAAGGGPGLVTRRRRKRPVTEQRREAAGTWRPLGLTLPTAVESVRFAYAGEAAGGRRGPRYG